MPRPRCAKEKRRKVEDALKSNFAFATSGYALAVAAQYPIARATTGLVGGDLGLNGVGELLDPTIYVEEEGEEGQR
jgi:hypothetical protein